MLKKLKKACVPSWVNISKNNNSTKTNLARLTTNRICTLSLSLTLLVMAKWRFFLDIPGTEIVTSLFILYALMFSWKECLLLIICFNFLVLEIYGFGLWWIAYWWIWPTNVLITKLGNKLFSKNKFTLTILGFLLGFMINVYYFLFDIIFTHNLVYAVADSVSGLPTNIFEGLGNASFLLICSGTLLKTGWRLNVFHPKIKQKHIHLNVAWFLRQGKPIATFKNNNNMI